MQTPFFVETPIGPLQITLTARGLAALDWHPQTAGRPAETLDEQAIAQAILAYFSGTRHDFQDFPLDVSTGTPFQQSVWKTLLTIPYGETRSYEWLADTLGKPKAFRAVGQANGRNPLPIIIPCHRVVNKSGRLGGYALGAEGGLQIKTFLLELEQTHSPAAKMQPLPALA